MPTYTIDRTEAALKGGNHGPSGWAFTVFSDLAGDDAPYRDILAVFARLHPEALVTLPDWEKGEDCVEGSLTWGHHHVTSYFEAVVLSFLKFWSSNRAATESLRTEILKSA